MHVHHFDCGSMVPLGSRLLLSNEQRRAGISHLACHVLLVETEKGLVLVDSGMGMADVERPRERLGSAFLHMMRPQLLPAQTALRQIEALGLNAADVRHIVLTHLDLDHAGGIADFPHARIHVLADEHNAAMAGRTLIEKNRYRSSQWGHSPEWSLHTPQGEPWFGFDCVRDLDDLPPEILMVPLAGHSRGHSAVAIDSGQGWLLHAGDAYFNHAEVHPGQAQCPVGLKLFQKLAAIDNGQRHSNQQRLRELARDNPKDIQIFCAHDPLELNNHRRS